MLDRTDVQDIWLLDLSRAPNPLTFDPHLTAPRFGRLMELVGFLSNRDATHTQTCFSSRPRCGRDTLLSIPTISPQVGRATAKAFVARYGKMRAGVWLMPLSGDRQPKPLFQSQAFDQGAQLSRPMVASSHIRRMNRGDGKFTSRAFRLCDKLMVSSTGGACRCGEMMARNCSI
jgi:hypothetical protein